MPTEVFRGRYADSHVIVRELARIFPRGGVRVTPERGRFFCTVPTRLTQAQRYAVEDAIEAEHYARDN